jgi:hypothetical protein
MPLTALPSFEFRTVPRKTDTAPRSSDETSRVNDGASIGCVVSRAVLIRLPPVE